MATIDYTIEELRDYTPHVYLVKWEGLTNGDQGRPIEFVDHADRTVQFLGTFDTSTVSMKGSMDGTTYGLITDADNANVEVTAAGAPLVLREIPRYTRPECTAGGGSTDIDCYLLIRRNRP